MTNPQGKPPSVLVEANFFNRCEVQHLIAELGPQAGLFFMHCYLSPRACPEFKLSRRFLPVMARNMCIERDAIERIIGLCCELGLCCIDESSVWFPEVKQKIDDYEAGKQRRAEAARKASNERWKREQPDQDDLDHADESEPDSDSNADALQPECERIPNAQQPQSNLSISRLELSNTLKETPLTPLSEPNKPPPDDPGKPKRSPKPEKLKLGTRGYVELTPEECKRFETELGPRDFAAVIQFFDDYYEQNPGYLRPKKGKNRDDNLRMRDWVIRAYLKAKAELAKAKRDLSQVGAPPANGAQPRPVYKPFQPVTVAPPPPEEVEAARKAIREKFGTP